MVVRRKEANPPPSTTSVREGNFELLDVFSEEDDLSITLPTSRGTAVKWMVFVCYEYEMNRRISNNVM